MFLLLVLATPAVPSQELIANSGVSASAISRTEARLYFTMRLQQWPNDQPVKVFVLPDANPLHGQFAKGLLGLFPYQLRRVWDRQVFSGTGQAPVTVADEDEMIQRVASTPGAVGYVETVPARAGIKPIEVR